MEFSRLYPERTVSLILECAVTLPYVLNSGNLREHVFANLMFNDPAMWVSTLVALHAPELVARTAIETESTLHEDDVRRVLGKIMNDGKRVEIVMGLIKSMSPVSLRRKGLKNDLKLLAGLENLHLEDVRTPTLIIHGTDDFDVPLEQAVHAADTVPGAELYLVQGGFHIMSLCERAQEWMKR